nr:S41 family peptidase [Bacteriovorax sp. HI3]
MDHARNKIHLISFLSIFLSACSPKPGEVLIKDLETKYANLYVNGETTKRQAIKELSDYLEKNSFTDENLETINHKLHKIGDGHVVLYDSRAEKNVRYQSGLKFYPGSFIVSSCESCIPAVPAGKYALAEVNNKPLSFYIEEKKDTVAASSKWGRDYRVVELLRENPKEEDITVRLIPIKGQAINTKLQWTKKENKTPVCVSSERLRDDLFKLNVLSLWCDDPTAPGDRNQIFENFKKQFDAAIAGAKPTDKFIIDLRENGGGGDYEVEYVLNTFFEKSIFVYKYQYLRKTHPGTMKWIEKIWPFKLGLWSPVEFQYADLSRRPSQTFFNNRAVTMISAGCFSSCEGIASALKQEKRTVVIGETTHGGAGDPVPFPIKGTPFSINLPTCVVWQKDGSLYEGQGVKPDMVKIQDRLSPADDVLQMAIGLIQ